VLRRRSARARPVDFAFGPRILALHPDTLSPQSGERKIVASLFNDLMAQRLVQRLAIEFCGISGLPSF
jgi:hypothetical protein